MFTCIIIIKISEIPKPPLDRKSDDESWFLQAKLSPVDLNPFFGSSSSESLIIDDDLDVISTVGKKKKRKRGAHETFYNDFVDIMDKADNQNQEIMDFIQHKLSDMKIEMLQKMNKTASESSTSNNAISSFPNIEKCRNRKRLAPPSSPSRTNKRRNINFADV